LWPGTLSLWTRTTPRGARPRPGDRRCASPTATALTLAADSQATNSIDAPDRVVPVTSQVTGVAPGFTYTVPANGVVVLKLGLR